MTTPMFTGIPTSIQTTTGHNRTDCPKTKRREARYFHELSLRWLIRATQNNFTMKLFIAGTFAGSAVIKA